MAETSAVIKLSATDDGATSTIERVGGAATSSAGSTNNLKKELRELQQQLASLDPNSKAFQELSVRAGQVKDQINDAAEAVRANAGNAFENLGNNSLLLQDRLSNLDFAGVASAVQGLAGNVASLTFSSLTAGVQQAGTAFLNLGKTLLMNPIFWIGAVIAAVVIYWEDLARAIGLTSAESERAAKLQADLSDEIANQTKAIGKQLSQAEALFDAVMNQNLADSERLQALEDINTLYPGIFENQTVDINNTEALSAAKKTLIANLLAEAKAKAAAALLEKEYASQIENTIKVGQLQAQYESDDYGIYFGRTYDDIQAEIKAANASLDASAKNIVELEKLVGDQVLSTAQTEAETIRTRNKNTKSRAETTRTTNKDVVSEEQKLNAEIAKLAEEEYQRSLDQFDKEARAIDLKYTELLKQAGNNAEQRKQLEELYQGEIRDLNKKQADEILKQEQDAAAKLKDEQDKLAQQKAADDQKAYEDAIARQQAQDQLILESMQEGLDKELAMRAAKYDADILAAEGNAEAQKLITEKYVNDVAAIEEKAASESLKKKLDQVQTWGKLTGDAFNAIADLDKAFQKDGEKNNRAAFNRNKAYSIAQAVIQTGLAVTAALTAGGNPVKLATGRQFIEAGIAATVGLAQVATIAKTQYNAGGGTSASSSSSSIPSAGAAGGGGGGGVAQFNPLNTNFVNNRPNQVAQTYVLAGDVANAQEARNRVQDLARL
jgi:hypothetical protein